MIKNKVNYCHKKVSMLRIKHGLQKIIKNIDQCSNIFINFNNLVKYIINNAP